MVIYLMPLKIDAKHLNIHFVYDCKHENVSFWLYLNMEDYYPISIRKHQYLVYVYHRSEDEKTKVTWETGIPL